MSRTQDLIGILKGLQILIKDGSQTHSIYLAHLWKNSAIRELLETQIKTSQLKTKQFVKNPTKELEEMSFFLKETMDRTSVVVKGFQQFTAASYNNNNSPISKRSINTDLSDYDMNTITLKELEKILEDHKIREAKSNQDVEEKEHIFGELGVNSHAENIIVSGNITNTGSFTKDEKYLSDWMVFLKSHEPKPIEELAEPKVEKSPELDITLPSLNSVAKQRKVPSSRIGRLVSFGGLFTGLGVGTINELTKGALGLGGSSTFKEAIFSPSNAERIVDKLCQVRGAALKLGQILSIQDSNIVSPQLVKAFERVRQAADYMPDWQVEKMIKSDLGSDWRDKFARFDNKPFAAASIGQVHRALTQDGTEVAVKIQYPGVAQSIDSDIDNLVGLLKVWDVFPKGMFIDNVVQVAKRELAWEVDYIREADYTEKFKELISHYPEFKVPKVIREVTTKSILTTELVPGVSLDKCFDMSYEHRHTIGKAVMKLCLLELFEFRCMQTDPNWSNFLYDKSTKKLMLIDFGSSRFYTKQFMDNYLKVIMAAVNDNPEEVLAISKKMSFLTGYETKQMEEAHVKATMILGEVFRCPGEFNFGLQQTTKSIAHLVPTMIAHRLCPPPEEIYSIHRKLSGVFLLCARLKIKLACRPMFEEIANKYNFNS